MSKNNNPWTPEFSTACFFKLPDSGRDVFNFNVGWRFHKGKVRGAQKTSFDDSEWQQVNVPHGLELLPQDASASINYQGEAWYRKRFKVEKSLKGKKLLIYFEAIMGKSKVWLNGKLVKKHFGGYLPVIMDVTDAVEYGKENIIAVWADNSNDPEYPPGKPQEGLDFTYFGGIYRDVWMITTNKLHITDANLTDKVAGGGVFVRFENVSEKQAEVFIDTHILNESDKRQEITIETEMLNQQGSGVGKNSETANIAKAADLTVKQQITVKQLHLWHVDDPYLHNLIIRLKNSKGKILDGVRLRIGIRSIEFRGKKGFFLNGKSFDDKLIGGNRHQDFALVGNALPNTTHWRDAKKMRDAAMRVVRSAHYPQDPAFMDACDELGLLVIVATPGWQFWNDNPAFANLVFCDIRNMVRRDRNHASTLMWEPILNETGYPAKFAKKASRTVHEEYPYPGCYTACDDHAPGNEVFDVAYSNPYKHGFWNYYLKNTPEKRREYAFDYANESRSVFTREWGDCVDNWHDHNSPSRVAKSWGETAQLKQAAHYCETDYLTCNWDSLYRPKAQHVGGALWHTFDHQRGYHADPFWGGIMDSFRQPKYSYYLFKSQLSSDIKIKNVDSDPFVFIAHEMTPFSCTDVTVFSNCEEVRLKFYGKTVGTKSTCPKGSRIPHQPVVFKNAFDWMVVKNENQNKEQTEPVLKAEGLIGGKVVTCLERNPAGFRCQITLEVDSCGVALIADGSDFVPVVARIQDKDGNIKRYTDDYIRFSVSGVGELIDNGTIQANPQKLEWGEAVALVRAGSKPGKIKVKAQVHKEGLNTPQPAEIVINSIPSPIKQR